MNCSCCDSYGLCAANCLRAPWNQDKPKASRFEYLLRQRRWASFPVSQSDIFWTKR
jgi:hypothetical protein